MVRKRLMSLGALLLLLTITACGTLEVGFEATAQAPSPTLAVATEAAEATPQATVVEEEMESGATLTPEPEETAEEAPEPEATQPLAQDPSINVPPGWQGYANEEYGISLAIPPGHSVEIREPATPTAWNERIPDGVEEQQLFIASVMQESAVVDSPANAAQVLEFKVVANPDGLSVGEMADLFSLRCPEELTEPVTLTTMAPGLQGYRYTCQGMFLFNEFWAPYGDQPDMIFGAAWGDMFSPVAENILATVSIDPN